MSDEISLKLIWRGAETVDAVRQAIDADRHVEITLPANFHHALYKHLHPREPGAGAETLNMSGGAELLEAMASLTGLEELAKLVRPLQRRRYRTHLGDPAFLTLAPPAPSD